VSKIKKKERSVSTQFKEDVIFEKIIGFTGWVFLLVLLIFLGVWLIFDNLIGLIDLHMGPETFAFILFMGTNAGLCFGLVAIIKNNRDQKKKFFLDWLCGEFLLSMFAVFAIAAYQW
jgi:uncharacterized membrane protein